MAAYEHGTDEKPSRVHGLLPARKAEYDLDSVLTQADADAQDYARLIRKLDCFIVPPIMLLYLFSFLDRVNIGNARLFGFEDELNLGIDDRYQTAVSILFATYLATEVPSNLVVKRVGASRWLSFIAVGWGIVATLTGIVQSYGGLIATRLVLGAFEGCLYPALIIYLTMFYEKRELGVRTGYLFVSAALAGAFGGLLSYGIGHMDGVAGLRGWRWIFILEGIPTVLLGIAAWFWLADEPQSAWYLTIKEKQLMRARRDAADAAAGQDASAHDFAWPDVRNAFLDPKVWLMCIAQNGFDSMLYGYSTFLPTIIAGLDVLGSADRSTSSTTVQLLTVPCYALGAIAYLVCAFLSDRQQRRAAYIIPSGIVSVVGYAILLADVSAAAHYFGCFLIAIGLYTAVGLCYPLLASNLPRYGKRAAGIGLQLTVGNSAGLYAPYLYSHKNAAGIFVVGHAATLGLVGMACVVHAGLWMWHASINRARRAQMGKDEDTRDLTVDKLGDDSPRFLYTT